MSNNSKIQEKLKIFRQFLSELEANLAENATESLNVVAIEIDDRETYVFPNCQKEEAERIMRMMFPNIAYRITNIPYRTYFRVREFYGISDYTTN